MRVWKFLPPAYAPKYLDLQIDRILNNQLNEAVRVNYTSSAPIVLLVSSLIIIIFIKWGQKWEGTDFEIE